MTCPGPCDVISLQPGFPEVTSPTHPSSSYKRGQRVKIKYQRNNHGPGGFVRHTLVPIDKMMDKNVHKKNAFHFTCWGSHAVVAARNELGRDKRGFSLVGGDGKLHSGRPGYYVTELTIPQVVPDGVYVLGWVWYGGIGGSLASNTVGDPHKTGLFADYWSCSFVEIKGGPELQDSYTPVFKTGMSGDWSDACNSMNDRPGVCVYEPCVEKAEFMQPREFRNGAVPPALTPANFASKTTEPIIPTPVPDEAMGRDALAALKKCEVQLGKSVADVEKLKTLKKVLVSLYQCKRLLEKEESLKEEAPLFDEAEKPMPDRSQEAFLQFLASADADENL